MRRLSILNVALELQEKLMPRVGGRDRLSPPPSSGARRKETDMATMAFPISQLAAVVAEAEQAQWYTRYIVCTSGSPEATPRNVYLVIRGTLGIRGRLSHLVTLQTQILNDLVGRDFVSGSPAELLSLAEKIDTLVEHEREMLRDANSLGVAIRVWWQKSLLKLSDQVEHFDSISESLHAAADTATIALMAMAMEQFSAVCEGVAS